MTPREGTRRRKVLAIVRTVERHNGSTFTNIKLDASTVRQMSDTSWGLLCRLASLEANVYEGITTIGRKPGSDLTRAAVVKRLTPTNQPADPFDGLTE